MRQRKEARWGYGKSFLAKKTIAKSVLFVGERVCVFVSYKNTNRRIFKMHQLNFDDTM